MKNYLISVLILTFVYINSYCQETPVGSPACPYPTQIAQPNGDLLDIKIKGNGHIHYLETIDGYTIMKDPNDDTFKYMVGDKKGDLLLTDIIVNNTNKRNKSELSFLNQIDKNLRFSGEVLKEKSASSESNHSHHDHSHDHGPEYVFPSTGIGRALLLLVDFPDQISQHTVGEFDNLANQSGYNVNGQTGSFRDYYIDASYGQLTINTDVRGWYTAANGKAYYGEDAFTSTGARYDIRPRDLVREAVDAAEADGVNFSLYDGDNDGVVDVVMVIHSGRGQEESGDSDDIWSHKWSLGSQQVTYDGVTIYNYIIQPEKYSSSNTIANIGVLCHEFGHVLGLPDLYDRDYSSNGIGSWGLMAGGTWNNNGKTPANMSAWTKAQLGWITPIELSSPTTISNLPNLDASASCYKVNTSNPNEYFLITNRQKVGWDAHIPGEGLAIWHIDDNVTTQNDDETHYLVHLEQADGLNDLNNRANRGDAGDLFPGTANNTSFDDNTNPNAKMYNGTNTNICISNIVESGTNVGFEFGCTGGGGSSDLVISAKSTRSGSALCGGALLASATVKNDGAASTNGPSYLGYYLSNNTTFDASDTYLGRDYVEALAANATSNESATLNIPAGTAAGTYYILFVADYENVITESNENNNVAYEAITVTCDAGESDLVITAKSTSLTTVACGRTLLGSATVKNNGPGATSGPSYLGYYLSNNTTLDASDTYLRRANVGTLAANVASNESTTLTIPEGIAAGNYYILFVADYENVISESNENNNVAYQAITVTCVPGEPDLIISAKSTALTTVACGSSVLGRATVKNNGEASTNGTSYLGYYLSNNTTLDASDTYLTRDPVVTLAINAISNESATLNIPAGTAAGTYYILFVADYQNVITESNENNNVAYQAINVTCATGEPDLIISAKSTALTTVACGSSVLGSATVKNNGTASANSASYLGYYLSTNTTLDASDTYLTRDYVNSLVVNGTNSESAALTIPTGTAAGTYYILFVADYQNAITESNENNNVAYQAINVTCAAGEPDLIISAKSTALTTVACGSSVLGSATVKNNGTASTDRGSDLGYYLSTNTTLDASDTYLTRDIVTILAPNATNNESATLAIPTGTAAGTYYILFVADYKSVITESNENNNVAYQAINVTCAAGEPDLIISAKSTASTTVACGSSVLGSATVKNNGTASANSASYLGYYLSTNTTLDASDTYLRQDFVGTLAPNATGNESATLAIPSGLTAGTYYILFVADYQNAITESNENNNVAYQAINVTCAATEPDLVVTSQSANPINTTCGVSTSVTATVKNNGTASVGVSDLGYYLSTNSTFDASDIFLTSDAVGTLPPGITSNENALVTIPAGTTAGAYHILFVADYQGAITESNESNNVSSILITVTCDNACTPTTPTASQIGNAEHVYCTHAYGICEGHDGDDKEFELTNLSTGGVSNYTTTNFYVRFNGLTQSTNYKYRVRKQCGTSGSYGSWSPYQNFTTTSCKIASEALEFSSYPNPFSTHTTIEFSLPEDLPVTIFVTDMTGKQIATLLNNEEKHVGKHEVIFNGSNYPAGMYYYTIQAGEYRAMKKMIIAK